MDKVCSFAMDLPRNDLQAFSCIASLCFLRKLLKLIVSLPFFDPITAYATTYDSINATQPAKQFATAASFDFIPPLHHLSNQYCFLLYGEVRRQAGHY